MFSRISLEWSLGALLVLTLLAILGERAILETRFSFTPKDGLPVALYDDDVSGGASVGEFVDRDAYEWQCELVMQYSYPFCGMEVLLDPERLNGLDLSNYDSVKLWLDYQGPTDTIRFYLRNFNSAYSKPGHNASTKYNLVEFDTSELSAPVELPLDYFFVANWWYQQYKIAPEHTTPDFSNIVVVEVQTGGRPKEGLHTFKLNKMEFTGQLLSTVHWYQLIMGVWLVFAFTVLIARLVQLTSEVRRRSQREQELLEVNAVLDRRGKQLAEMARTDPLTGAFNRQGIKEAVKVGLSEWRRESKPMSLIMLDIDHFKRINDTYGHSVGDRTLAKLAETVQLNIRSSDLFARWGGEEFVLVCRDTGGPEAAKLAEKLQAVMAEAEFENNLQVTASFGVATLRAGESLDQLFLRADQALYQAKAAGRDCVIVAGQTGIAQAC